MSSSSAQKIKERLSIVDVISSYLSLQPAGKNYKAKCPFHNEKTPSFFISPDRNSYYCFGCGAKGDIFSFVENFEGTDFLGALKMLAERAGVTLENNFEKDSKDQKDRLYKIMEEATSFFENNLKSEPKILNYLKERGLLDKTIENFRIGYAPDSWKSTSTYLLNRGFSRKELEEVGLIKNKDQQNFYDRFRNRIIFPISDSSGRVIAFSGRLFDQGNSTKEEDFGNVVQAKYLNSPETTLFNKSNTLFGIDKAKGAIRKAGYSILVEGQMDLVLSHQAGFTNTVAVSGTALSDRTDNNDSVGQDKVNNLGLIRRLSQKVILAFDGDQAGLRAVDRSAKIALASDMQVKVAVLPLGQDPADIILKDVNVWRDIIKNSVNIISFHLDKICEVEKDLRLRGQKVKEQIFPLLVAVQSQTEKESYLDLIRRQTGLLHINDDFKDYSKDQSEENINRLEDKYSKKSRKDRLAERLVGIVLWRSEKWPIISKKIDLFKEKIGAEEFDRLWNQQISNSSVLIFEAESLYNDNEEEVVRNLEELLFNLEEEILNERRILLLDQINQKEREKDKEAINTVLKNYQQIVERIENIKNNRLNKYE